ncbi:MAG: hypothetical protein E6J68_16680 [Deltaproteobacteria bacterium]|nr:MAG: hypothetical protein E6J68_16680 [Deltaproteobacteria bacterium]
MSLDGDHVLEDLRSRFDEVLAALEAAAGWRTERIQRPVLILGELHGVLTGIRQLRRTRDALRPFDEIYRQASGVSPLAEVVERLAAAAPADKTDIDLTQYRGIKPPWNDWGHLAARGRYWARRIAPVVLEG